MLQNILLLLLIFVAGSILFVIFMPLSHAFKRLGMGLTFGVAENLKDRFEPHEQSGFCGAFGGRRGLIILGGSLGLAGIVTLVLLIMGKTGTELLDIFVEYTVLGSITELTENFGTLPTAVNIVSVGISAYIGGLLMDQFQETKWYIKALAAPIVVIGATALAIILRIPFGWLANLGKLLIAPLFQGWEGQKFLNFLRLIPAIIVAYIALLLIVATISEYFAVFAATAMGLTITALIAIIPSFFGFEIPSDMGDGTFVVLILAIEVFKEYMVDIYLFLSDHISFLPDFGLDDF